MHISNYKQNDNKYIVDKILLFLKDAGEYALEARDKNSKTGYNKNGGNIMDFVTKTDVDISDKFANFAAQNFNNLNYMIIDEEKTKNIGDSIFDKIDASEYQFVIDPIDGTIPYAQNHDTFGTIIGVFKNGIPVVGFIYQPAAKELVYTDGDKSYWVREAFNESETKTVLNDNPPSQAPIVFGHDWDWEKKSGSVADNTIWLNYWSSASHTNHVLTGRASAYFMSLKLWDIAGAMAIGKNLGINFYDYNTKKECTNISREFFTPKMNTNSFVIQTHYKNFDRVHDVMNIRKDHKTPIILFASKKASEYKYQKAR